MEDQAARTGEAQRMNALEDFIQRENLDETEAMNELQENGIISDHAVHACDVPARDATPAVEYLRKKHGFLL